MSFLRHSLSAGAGRIASTGLQFLTIVIVAAFLGPEGQGQFAFLALVPMVAWTVLNLGLPDANLYLLGKGRVSPGTLAAGAVLWSALWGGAALVVWLAADRAGWQWGTLRLLEPYRDNPFLMHGCVAAIGPLMLFNIGISSYLGRGRLDLFNGILIGRSGMALIGILAALWLFGGGLGSIYAIWLVSICLGGLPLVADLLRQPPSLTKLRGYFQQGLSYGSRVYLAGVAVLLMYRMDQFLVKYFCGDADMGRYSLATQVAESILLITGPMYMLTIPRTAQGGDKQANRETPRTFRLVFWALVLALPVLYGLFLLLLAFLERRGYSPGDAALAFAWLLPGMLFMGVDQIISGDLAGRGKQIWNTIVASSMLGVNIALDLWWIPRYGIAGAAVATSVAYIAGCLITLGIFLSFSKTSWRNLFIPTREDFNLLYSRLKR